MATKLNKILSSTLFFTSIILNFPCMITSDDVCPYPCYPPPTGTGTGTGTVTPSPPATFTPPSQSASYPPPVYNPTPTGNLPYYPPPPYGISLYGPPPPDPILPYFPFYYREPLHQKDNQSSATSLGKSMVMITTLMNVFVFVFLLLLV